MFKFQKQRVEARKLFLNRFDIINFDDVPDHIVDAFYGSCTYHNRLIVSTFGYLNGLDMNQIFELGRWKDMKPLEKNKILVLYQDFEKPRYKNDYYSYNVHHKIVMYLNGDSRKYGAVPASIGQSQSTNAKKKDTTEVKFSPTISEILAKRQEDANGANENVRFF